MDYKQLVATSRTLKEVLVRQGLPPTFYRRQQLNKLISQNDWALNSIIPYDRPLGCHGIWTNITPHLLLDIIRRCECWTQVQRELGIGVRGSSVLTVHKYAKLINADTSHFKGKAVNNTGTRRIPNDQLFVNNSSSSSATVRKRILKEQLIKYQCNDCGQLPTHNNKSLKLQLEHKNGNPSDHRLSNLTFLCPNCHTQTITWGMKKR